MLSRAPVAARRVHPDAAVAGRGSERRVHVADVVNHRRRVARRPPSAAQQEFCRATIAGW